MERTSRPLETSHGMNLILLNLFETYKLNQQVYLETLKNSKNRITSKISDISGMIAHVNEIITKNIEDFIGYINLQRQKFDDFMQSDYYKFDERVSDDFDNLFKEYSNYINIFKFVKYLEEQANSLKKFKNTEILKNISKRMKDFKNLLEPIGNKKKTKILKECTPAPDFNLHEIEERNESIREKSNGNSKEKAKLYMKDKKHDISSNEFRNSSFDDDEKIEKIQKKKKKNEVIVGNKKSKESESNEKINPYKIENSQIQKYLNCKRNRTNSKSSNSSKSRRNKIKQNSSYIEKKDGKIKNQDIRNKTNNSSDHSNHKIHQTNIPFDVSFLNSNHLHFSDFIKIEDDFVEKFSPLNQIESKVLKSSQFYENKNKTEEIQSPKNKIIQKNILSIEEKKTSKIYQKKPDSSITLDRKNSHKYNFSKNEYHHRNKNQKILNSNFPSFSENVEEETIQKLKNSHNILESTHEKIRNIINKNKTSNEISKITLVKLNEPQKIISNSIQGTKSLKNSIIQNVSDDQQQNKTKFSSKKIQQISQGQDEMEKSEDKFKPKVKPNIIQINLSTVEEYQEKKNQQDKKTLTNVVNCGSNTQKKTNEKSSNIFSPKTINQSYNAHDLNSRKSSLRREKENSTNKELPKPDLIQHSNVFDNNKKIDAIPCEENQEISSQQLSELFRKFRSSLIDEENAYFLCNNLTRYIHSKIIYYSEFIMDENNRIFQSQNFIKSQDLLDKCKFKYVQVVFLKKEGQKLNSSTKVMEKFFESYIKRKDERGNFMMKGILRINSFIQLENYFNSNFKCLNVIDVVQITVFLFKVDIFFDYSEYHDKTNLMREDIKSIIKMYQILSHLRKNYAVEGENESSNENSKSKSGEI